MAKVFVSYSTKNEKLLQKFIEFMRLGMGVEKRDIFCTVFSNALPTGDEFVREIKEKMEQCEVVISLITEEYLSSKFCVMEMGAAWALSKHFFPLIMVSHQKLNDTPLMGIQMRKLGDEQDLSTVYEELYHCGVVQRLQIADFNSKLPEFCRYVEQESNGNFVLQQDQDGYYETTITNERIVRGEYRCYRIRGKVDMPLDNQTADSEWIFFFKGVYPDLQIGDIVRFKLSKTQVRKWNDIGWARNLYPSELIILNRI